MKRSIESYIPLFLATVLVLPQSVGSFARPWHSHASLRSTSTWALTSTPDDGDVIHSDMNDTANHDDNTEAISDPTATTTSAATFDDLGLSPTVLSAARSMTSWTTPTPIQRLAIPALLTTGASNAAWCQAPTGSGKTAAFLLPLLHKMTTSTLQFSSSSHHLQALILVPTRELAVQVGAVAHTLCQNLQGKQRNKYEVQVVHGGVPLQPQLARISQANLLIATPGRLVDLLTQMNDGTTTAVADATLEQRLLDALNQQGKPNASLSYEQLEKLQQPNRGNSVETKDSTFSTSHLLEHLEYLVLDEADRLLNQGFEQELNSLLDLLPRKPTQTWLFSATFPKRIEPRVDALWQRLGHDEVVRLSCVHDGVLRDDENDDISGRLQKQLDRRNTAPVKAVEQVGPASTIDLQALRLDKPQRTQALRKLLQVNNEWDRVLVFVGTRYTAEHVARKLRRVGIKSAELHGKLDQEARLRRLNAFRKGHTRVLLATDVASRGLDVVGLPAVVNYDLPRSTADFVHRIGRTGRAGRTGTAVTFVTPETEAHYELIEKRHLLQPVERQILQGFEPNEEEWQVKSEAARISIPGADQHSSRGLAHDRMHGGIKGRRKSKKDRLREAAARKAQEASAGEH